MNAQSIAARAAEIVSGDRAKTHGDMVGTHRQIAALWNAYLGHRIEAHAQLDARDAALMMALLKVARAGAGQHNVDDYVDLAGYAACAGEIAERMLAVPK